MRQGVTDDRTQGLKTPTDGGQGCRSCTRGWWGPWGTMEHTPLLMRRFHSLFILQEYRPNLVFQEKLGIWVFLCNSLTFKHCPGQKNQVYSLEWAWRGQLAAPDHIQPPLGLLATIQLVQGSQWVRDTQGCGNQADDPSASVSPRLRPATPPRQDACRKRAYLAVHCVPCEPQGIS